MYMNQIYNIQSSNNILLLTKKTLEAVKTINIVIKNDLSYEDKGEDFLQDICAVRFIICNRFNDRKPKKGVR